MNTTTMDIYKSLKLKVPAKREEPDVWVRRVVIYEVLKPDPVTIRDVQLTKGLNVVWAEEPDADDSTAEITGHSAGKTSFCRLLRYVLGEKTFGTKANTEMIQRSFPGGYVAAELFVRNGLVSVIRPIGNGKSSYFKVGANIEELLVDRSQSANEDNYPEKIGLVGLLDHLDTGMLGRMNHPIQWGHVLAWCTRDQEARFQNIHEWRSPRSESNWPNFRFTKSDPLFVMRTLLGLFEQDELKGEEELSALQKEQEKLEKQLEELKREPQYRVNLFDLDLRQRIKAMFPDLTDVEHLPFQSGDLLPDLAKLAESAANTGKDALKTFDDDWDQLQEQIDDVSGTIKNVESRVRSLENVFKFQKPIGQEIDQGINQRQKVRNLYDEHANSLCILGNVLYQDCEYVQKRQGNLVLTEFQDAQAMENAEKKRKDAENELNAQIKAMRDEGARLTKERERLQSQRKTLRGNIADKEKELQGIQNAHAQLALWLVRNEMPGEYKDLDVCQDSLKSTLEKIERLEAELTVLLAKHDDNRKQIGSIFSGAVRAVLSSGTYDGQVNLANRELAFQIVHGPTMSGEAVETLSVLLADVACLVYNSVSETARLPGFLLHDSPREADLSLRIYRSFIRLMWALQQHFGSPEKCPFQYIITTTTAPPDEVVKGGAVKLPLNAAIPKELLFRRNVAAAAPDATESGTIWQGSTENK
jgi:hypothetical protein